MVFRARRSSGKFDSCFAGRKKEGDGVSGDGGGRVGSRATQSGPSLTFPSKVSGTFGRYEAGVKVGDAGQKGSAIETSC